jgi:PKHD-type hydroxylase
MLKIIRQILSPEEVKAVRDAAQSGQFVDGMNSAGFLVADRKMNEELAVGAEGRDQLVRMVLTRLWQNKTLQVLARPRRIMPPIMSRYRPGMRYGDHMDNAIMGGAQPFRVDCSITIFLEDPDSYEGGELVIDTSPGTQRIKLPPGDAMVYPTHYVHRVEEVTKGERLALVTWIESTVRDPARRQVLFELAVVAEDLHQRAPESDAFMTLEKARFNLLRMWADT